MKRGEHGSLPLGHMVGGRFRVDDFLGRGGMGEVYAATHVATGARRALKIIRDPGSATQDDIARFIREARAASAVEHPNVIAVQDVFEDTDGLPVIVMELLHGESLAELLATEEQLSLRDAARIFVPIARGVCAAHEKGIIHRDLKPQNVFLARDEAGELTVKVLDFGVAKVLDPRKLGVVTYGASTRKSHLVGTPEYMAFEQAMSEDGIDARADVWSYGVMLTEALSGRRPLHYNHIGQMIRAFLKESVPPARSLVPNVPADVHELLDACLHKERDRRLANLSRAVEVLSRHVDSELPRAVPLAVSQVPPRRRLTTWAALAVVVAVASIGALWTLVSHDAPPPVTELAREPKAVPSPQKAAPSSPTVAALEAQPPSSGAQATKPSVVVPVVGPEKTQAERPRRRRPAAQAQPEKPPSTPHAQPAPEAAPRSGIIRVLPPLKKP